MESQEIYDGGDIERVTKIEEELTAVSFWAHDDARFGFLDLIFPV